MNQLGESRKNTDSDSVGLRWLLRRVLTNMLLRDAGAAFLQNTHESQGLLDQLSLIP